MEKLLLREWEARQAVGLGKTKFNELLSSGAIRSFKVGRARVIPTAAIREWIDSQLADGGEQHAAGAPGDRAA